MTAASRLRPLDARDAAGAVHRDGIVGLPGAFEPGWAARLREDFDVLFAEARAHPGGTVGRGPQRHYFAVPPERLRGFVDLVTHPWITELAGRMLGPDWTVVEVAFDVPLPGAVHQPWHRDFRTPPETRDRRELTSLAVNVTAVDVTAENGPFEIVPGSHWEDGADFEHGMFPPPGRAAGYAARAVPKLPRLGDASLRTALAVHRGTPNRSASARPVLVLGLVSPRVDTSGAHDLMVTRAYAEALPVPVRAHLRCTHVVDTLSPLVQRHDIEGLRMGG